MLKHTEERLLAVMPQKEKKRYCAINAIPSVKDALDAEKDLLQWIQGTSLLDTSLVKIKKSQIEGSARQADPSLLIQEENQFLELNLPKVPLKKLQELREQLHVETVTSTFQKTNKAGRKYFTSSIV